MLNSETTEDVLMQELMIKVQDTHLSKLKKRYQEFLLASKQNNVIAKNNLLKSFIDECRSKERFCNISRDFVQNNLNISYFDLLMMKRTRQI